MNEFTKEFVKQVRKHLVHVIRFTEVPRQPSKIAQLEWLGKEVDIDIIKDSIEIWVNGTLILALPLNDDIHENSKVLNKAMSVLSDILNNKPIIRNEQ